MKIKIIYREPLAQELSTCFQDDLVSGESGAIKEFGEFEFGECGELGEREGEEGE